MEVTVAADVGKDNVVQQLIPPALVEDRHPPPEAALATASRSKIIARIPWVLAKKYAILPPITPPPMITTSAFVLLKSNTILNLTFGTLLCDDSIGVRMGYLDLAISQN